MYHIVLQVSNTNQIPGCNVFVLFRLRVYFVPVQCRLYQTIMSNIAPLTLLVFSPKRNTKIFFCLVPYSDSTAFSSVLISSPRFCLACDY